MSWVLSSWIVFLHPHIQLFAITSFLVVLIMFTAFEALVWSQ